MFHKLSFSLLAALAVLVLPPPLRAERQVEDLAAGWKFIQRDVGLAAPTDESWEAVTVPHTWNALDAQRGKTGNAGLTDGYYRGACWYARTLDAPPAWTGKRVFIRFEAASIVAKIYLNGELLGEHRGAFTAFCYELTSHLHFGGKNEIRAQVDNSHQDDTPPIYGDFNMDGGLYRPAQLIVTDAVCVSPLDFASPGVYVSAKPLTGAASEVEVRTLLSNGAANAWNVLVETRVEEADGKMAASSKEPKKLEPGATVPAVFTLTIPRARRWNGRKDPYLYSVRVRVYANDALVDEVVQPLGLRTVEITQDRGFLLNGEPYPVRGVNRHQDHLDQGWALTPANHEEDARLILEMGATAVRNTHYPQSGFWHDLADRCGLLMWDEVSNVDSITDTPAYTTGARLELTEMVHQLYNHPSVAFWGIFNELDNKKTPDPVPLLTRLKADLKELDPARIVVAATDHGKKPYNQVPEALCLNTYPGWYGGAVEEMDRRISGTAKEFGERRIALSEYGAGANPAQHMEGTPQIEKANSPFHPEEYQSHIHEVEYAAVKDNPKMWGSFEWVMFDFPAAPRREGGTKGLNDKGLVTQDRRVKKDAYYFYQANWTAEPMVYITSRRMTPRRQAVTEVKVYSNVAEVALKVNGEVMVKVAADKVNVFRWENVTLRPGKNLVEAAIHTGGTTVTDQCEWVLEE